LIIAAGASPFSLFCFDDTLLPESELTGLAFFVVIGIAATSSPFSLPSDP
jgi:hypothetical protein